MVAVLQKQMELRNVETNELIDYAVDQLSQASKQLKGDYMKGVIARMSDAKKKERPMGVIVEEFLNNYKTLLK